MQKAKKHLLFALKILISFTLLYWVIKKAEMGKIVAHLGEADMYLLTASVLLFVIITWVLSYRWMVISGLFGKKLNLYHLFKYYLYAYYFNNFLPTAIGGDVVRAYKIGQDLKSPANGLAAVIIDRVLGILATLTFASLGLIWTADYFHSMKIIYFALLFMVTVLAFIFTVLNSKIYLFLKEKLLMKIKYFDLGRRIVKVLDAVHTYREEKTMLFFGYVIALLAQALTVILNYIIALAIGLHISLGFLFFAVPISFLVTLFPSVNGLGVRDWSYVVLLSKVGVSNSSAVSISILVLAVQVFTSLFGGVLWVFEKNKNDIDKLAEEI